MFQYLKLVRVQELFIKISANNNDMVEDCHEDKNGPELLKRIANETKKLKSTFL